MRSEKKYTPEEAYKNLLKMKPFKDDGYYIWFFDDKGILSFREGKFPAQMKKFPKFRKPNSWFVNRNED